MEKAAETTPGRKSVFRRLVGFINPEDALRELVLIVSGILIALAIGNWNDAYKQQQAEIQILKELRSSLRQDLTDIESNANVCAESARAKKVLLAAFRKKEPYQDSLQRHLSKTTVFVYLVTNRAAYETLKSKGLDLVSNDSLRISITTLYEYTYKSVELSEDTQTGYLQDELQNYTSELFNIYDSYESPEQVYEHLRAHPRFRTFLLYSRAYNLSSEKNYRELARQVQQLIRRIDTELTRLEN
ncbi:MAG: DUF6090 family protein [Cytophagales bacterium]|nr:DUF6090 family protein [Cytophagales bacterium]